jgi:hypothetical protein
MNFILFSASALVARNLIPVFSSAETTSATPEETTSTTPEETTSTTPEATTSTTPEETTSTTPEETTSTSSFSRFDDYTVDSSVSISLVDAVKHGIEAFISFAFGSLKNGPDVSRYHEIVSFLHDLEWDPTKIDKVESILRKLVQLQVPELNHYENWGDTALIFAAHGGHVRIAQL